MGQSVKLYNNPLALALSGPSVSIKRIFRSLGRKVRSFPFTPVPMTDLRFKLESSYGRTRAYPIDQTAILLVRLTRAKTLLPSDIGTFAGLGYRCVDQEGNEITPSLLY